MFKWIQKKVSGSNSKYKVNMNEFDEDPLGWSRDLEEHRLGEFSMAAVQANGVMEDRSQLEVGDNALFVGIYDGQYGDTTSHFLSNSLFPNLISRIQENNDNMSEDILRETVAAMEEDFMLEVEEGYQEQPHLAAVGSSCLICIVWKGTLYIANVGDSRAVMGYLGPLRIPHIRKLVNDHNTQNKDIQNELLSLHPNDPNILIYNHHALRVGGISEVSRCIGNAYMKRKEFTLNPSFVVPDSEQVPYNFTRPLLSAEPAIHSRVLNLLTDRFIIFGSGGLWKLLTDKQAAKIVRRNPRDGIAKRIVRIAQEIAARRNNVSYRELCESTIGNGVSRGPSVSVEGTRRVYHDDISVIVVFFDRRPDPVPPGVPPPLIYSMPGINSYRGFSDMVQPSDFRYFEAFLQIIY